MAQQNADQVGRFDPVARAAEKQAARDRDEQSLASGAKSREQLWRENSFIRAAGSEIDFASVRVSR